MCAKGWRRLVPEAAGLTFVRRGLGYALTAFALLITDVPSVSVQPLRSATETDGRLHRTFGGSDRRR